MGNQVSTGNTNEEIESGVDTRSICKKDAEQRLIAELERLLENSIMNNNDLKSDSDNDSNDESSDESEDEELVRPKIQIDKTAMFRALLEAEKHNAELTQAEHLEETEMMKRTHQAEITVLRSVIQQREKECEDLKKKIVDLEKSADKWRNFYFDASFTNNNCKKCDGPSSDFGKLPTVKPRFRPHVSRRVKPTDFNNPFAPKDVNSNFKPNQIFNINTNGRKNEFDFTQGGWNDQNNWTWNRKENSTLNDAANWGAKFNDFNFKNL